MGDKKDKKIRRIAADVLILLLSAFVGISILLATDFFRGEPAALKEQYINDGVIDTGSVNLVSAIYLGYRAFDTLGEAIVLLVTVAGVSVIMGGRK